MESKMKPYYENEMQAFYQGDVREVLPGLEEHSVDMVVTSPPYYGLRLYDGDAVVWDSVNGCVHEFMNTELELTGKPGSPKQASVRGSCDVTARSGFCRLCGAWQGQLGLEPTPELYIKHLCDIFDLTKRVMKKTATLWVNIDDSYAGSWGNMSHEPARDYPNGRPPQSYNQGVPAKSLIGIPERFVLEMLNRGWIRRNTIIWHKGNPMPESVKDRFTSDFEYLYMFALQGDYYFEQQFEKQITTAAKVVSLKSFGGIGQATGPVSGLGERIIEPNPLGRNMRCVWHINTKPYKHAHFATFPPELIETPIKAGCPQFICSKCGKPREKIYKSAGTYEDRKSKGVGGPYNFAPELQRQAGDLTASVECLGYTDCGCNAPFIPGTVLDIFAGSGTTLQVALSLGRKSIGIDQSMKYCKLATNRPAQRGFND
jgi:DNA modification methylase